jgi:hypothetical protein
MIDLKLNCFNKYVESSTQLHLQYNKAKHGCIYSVGK